MRRYYFISFIASCVLFYYMYHYVALKENPDFSNGFQCWHWISFIALLVFSTSVLIFVLKCIWLNLVTIIKRELKDNEEDNKVDNKEVDKEEIPNNTGVKLADKALGQFILHLALLVILGCFIYASYKNIYFSTTHVKFILLIFGTIVFYEFIASKSLKNEYRIQMGVLLTKYDGPTLIAFLLLYLFLYNLNNSDLCNELKSYQRSDILATGTVGFHMIISTCSIIYNTITGKL